MTSEQKESILQIPTSVDLTQKDESSPNIDSTKATKASFSVPSKDPIKFVSLISRDDRPLYIQSFNIENATIEDTNNFLKYNFLSHIALDVLSSPVSMSLREQQQQHQQQGKLEMSVILLFIQDQVMVYGYETNNGLRIIVGLDQSYVVSDQAQLKQLFLDIHKCYIRAVLNPFNSCPDNEMDSNDSVLQSPTFDRNIKRIVDVWPRKLT